MPEQGKQVWHGWIVVVREPGRNDQFRCESIVHGMMHVQFTTYSAAAAIDWWDRKVGEHIYLQETPLGAFRVYTHDNMVDLNQPEAK